MKKGEILEFDIESYAYEGKGIAKIDYTEEDQPESDKKFVVFVDGSYPGDKVTAQIRRKKRGYAEARVEEVLFPSKDRVEPRCSYFGTCGGCKQQDLDYSAQAKYKEEQEKDLFERLGGFENFEIEPIVQSEKTFYYRNKMEFSFANKRWLTKDEIGTEGEVADRNFALGLHIPRIFDKVLDLKECFLQSEESNQIMNFTRNFFKSKKASIFSTKTHEGYLRHLVIKQASNTTDLMVNLVTSSQNDEWMEEYSTKLMEVVPSITTIVNNVNTKKSQTAYGDFENNYIGDGYIYDKIGDFKFRISANSFFQTNTTQAANLYQIALNYADLKGDEIVYDLYSGAGTISIYVSKNSKEVYAFEAMDSAVKDAKNNNKLNDIDNVTHLQADLNRSFLPIVDHKSAPKPDVIVLDPPRAGMNPKTVKDLINLAAPKIVYVSCNPATQARDIKLLAEVGYKLIKMQPIDMFPQTYHIENVALLVK
ncbi:MAG: 23S rRNA (uracil(1939)-C(5))-methyltransferase RlmD [Melioribacteraceae bacterium]|jgi:23S rRNA (uracil1939-C5)-methyltransferase|nr:23S rRNA (uracil(1939)-C(5))-methyltransferase RlmD [Melioribacteraceae bacterium]